MLAAAVALAAVTSAGCWDGEDGTPSGRGTSTAPATDADQPLTGVSITVTGRVSVVDEPHLISVGDTGSGPVLVFVPPGNPRVRSGDTVEATGAFRDFDRAQVEAEFGIRLDRRRIAEFVGQPVLVVTEIRKTR